MPLAAQCLEIGTIADLKGAWTDLTRNHTLTKNEIVCGDGRLQRVNDAKASPTDFLKIANRSDSRQMMTFECRDLLGCGKPLDLSALVNEEQRNLKGSGLLESFASWQKSHNGTAHTLSRGLPTPGTAVLRTAIIVAGKPIPVVEVFRVEAPAHTYKLDLCAHPTDTECGKGLPSPKEFSWQPGSPGNLPFTGPPAGINILYRLNDDDPRIRTNDRVLVIAVNPSDVDRIAEARDKIAVAALSVSSSDTAQVATFEEYVRSLANSLAKR